MIVLGIDPGSVICGYGVIKAEGKNLSLVEYGVINAKKISTEIPGRLKEIYSRLDTVIKRNKPDTAAFESLFYYKNAQSLMKLSHARSAAILSAAMNDIPIAEYSSREIKKSVSGRGNAAKEQVQFMVRTTLAIEETPEFFDTTDALAAAICHAVRSTSPISSSKSWEDFVNNNPHRIINNH